MKYYYQIEGDLRNNIGDVLQGMVAKPFLPASAEVVDREALSDIKQEEPALLIANGWYMHSFEKFPPPPNVQPIYLAVHVAQSRLLTNKIVRDHFKKNSPIGCRDHKTLKLFLGWGIPAYYSGCLTITAQARATVNNTGKGEVLLVDNVDHPIPDNVKSKLESLLGTSFIRVSHDPPSTQGTLEEYALAAEKHMNYLLERYCKASLVVTTKIHCALPCLGMGANVMLVHPNPSDPRLDTVAEFLKIMSYQDVLEATSLHLPSVDKKTLESRKAFISKIASDSVTKGENIMKEPNDKIFKRIARKSRIKAKIFRFAVVTALKTGLVNDQIKRIYGGVDEKSS